MTFLATLLFSFAARASIHAIVIPGQTAIVIMDALNGAQIDPEPRRLYEAMAMPPQTGQGGMGKFFDTKAKDFSLTCATKGTTRDSVLCNIVVKPASVSKISFGAVEYHLSTDESKEIFAKLAGNKATAFHFNTMDHALTIDATPEHFDFVFKQ